MRPQRLPLVTEHTGDAGADRVQRAVQKAIRQLSLLPFGSGVLLKTQTISTSSTAFNHGLGRTPAGVLVLYSTVAVGAPGWPAAQPTDTTKQSNLIFSANGTADLWFF